jgi:hypothetical protein
LSSAQRVRTSVQRVRNKGLHALAERVGGVSGLAVACDVSLTTVEAWLSNERKPSRLNYWKLMALARSLYMPPPFDEAVAEAVTGVRQRVLR